LWWCWQWRRWWCDGGGGGDGGNSISTSSSSRLHSTHTTTNVIKYPLFMNTISPPTPNALAQLLQFIHYLMKSMLGCVQKGTRVFPILVAAVVHGSNQNSKILVSWFRSCKRTHTCTFSAHLYCSLLSYDTSPVCGYKHFRAACYLYLYLHLNSADEGSTTP
jgi:hypothetical protein